MRFWIKLKDTLGLSKFPADADVLAHKGNPMNPILEQILKLVLCAAAAASISMTLTKAKVFSPLRQAVKAKSKFLGDLFSCPYCMSHWVSFLLVLVFQPRPIQVWLPVDLLLSAFIMVALAPLFAYLIYHVYNGMESENSDYKPLGGDSSTGVIPKKIDKSFPPR